MEFNKNKTLDNRYSRQVLFNYIGQKGQRSLSKSKITIIGCGGLGSVLANNFVRAGIGFLTIIDKDFLELNNLQRQMLFEEEDIGKSKAVLAKEKLIKINSDVKIEIFQDEINNKNINKYISNPDIIIDGTDNLKTRYIINDYSLVKKIPFIFGAVAASYGMVYTSIPDKKRPCLRCIFAENEFAETEALTSKNAGILNTIVNVVASIQTTEALKILTDNLIFLTKGLIYIDLWDLSLEIINIKKNDKCICSK